ncbi:MAG: response regulator [Deltaproteobacteria bacterium]|nr:response regulator [Deltaproteobacteria bacterium]
MDTILLIDDDETNLEILEGYLEDDYKIIKETQPQKCIRILDKNPGVKAIILDWTFPDCPMDGLELLQEIKSTRFSNIPVVMQTGRATSADITTGINGGAYQYLTKPFDGKVIKSMVRSAVMEFDKLENLSSQAQTEIKKVKDYVFRFIQKSSEKSAFDNKTHAVIQEFFINSLSCFNHEELTKLLMNSIKEFRFLSAGDPEDYDSQKLRCSVKLSSEEEVDLSDRGINSNVDQLILQKVIETGDMLQKGSYTAISSKEKNAAILIRNTPKDLHEAKSAINIMSMLLEMFETRLIHFEQEVRIRKREKQIQQVVLKVSRELDNINGKYQSIKEKQMDVIEQFTNAPKQIPNLSEIDRASLKSIFEKITDNSMGLFGEDQITDQVFMKSINDLKHLFGEGASNDQAFAKQLGGADQSDVDSLLEQFGM